MRDALISSIAVATLFAEEDISSATDEMELIFAVACSVEDATVRSVCSFLQHWLLSGLIPMRVLFRLI